MKIFVTAKERDSIRITKISRNLKRYETESEKVTILRWWSDGDRGKLNKIDDQCG